MSSSPSCMYIWWSSPAQVRRTWRSGSLTKRCREQRKVMCSASCEGWPQGYSGDSLLAMLWSQELKGPLLVRSCKYMEAAALSRRCAFPMEGMLLSWLSHIYQHSVISNSWNRVCLRCQEFSLHELRHPSCHRFGDTCCP